MCPVGVPQRVRQPVGRSDEDLAAEHHSDVANGRPSDPAYEAAARRAGITFQQRRGSLPRRMDDLAAFEGMGTWACSDRSGSVAGSGYRGRGRPGARRRITTRPLRENDRVSELLDDHLHGDAPLHGPLRSPVRGAELIAISRPCCRATCTGSEMAVWFAKTALRRPRRPAAPTTRPRGAKNSLVSKARP